MAPTLQDVSMLLGLPIAGRAVVARSIDADWRQQLLQRFQGVLPVVEDQPPQFEFTDAHGPTKAWLLQFQAERLTDDAEDIVVRRHLEAYLLWLFGWVLFSSWHHDIVDKHLISYAQQIADAPLDEVPQFSWGSAVLAATYRALCDACTRRSKTGTLAGCPLLLMLWSFERFDIGQPRLHSYADYELQLYRFDDGGDRDPFDASTMCSLWLKRDPYWATDIARLSYKGFIAALDQLTPDRVRWTPYTLEAMAARASRGLSHMCYRDQAWWLTRKRIVYDVFVEFYSVHRVLRQLGCQQQFPLPHTRKGQGLAYEASWASAMVTWADAWAVADTDTHAGVGPYDESTYGPYLHWFHGATRWRCYPVPARPQQHHAEITDTFATQPPAAFNDMTDICSLIGAELNDFAERLEASPPRVARAEMVSGLRRLAKRCMDGVRRASCRSVRDVQIPPHRTPHPSAPMESTPSSSGPRTAPSWHAPAPSRDAAGPSTPAIVADASGSTGSFFRGDWL